MAHRNLAKEIDEKIQEINKWEIKYDEFERVLPPRAVLAMFQEAFLDPLEQFKIHSSPTLLFRRNATFRVSFRSIASVKRLIW